MGVPDTSHPRAKVPSANIVQHRFLNSVSVIFFFRLSGQVAKNWAVPSNGAISTSARPTHGYLGRLLSLVTTTQGKYLTSY